MLVHSRPWCCQQTRNGPDRLWELLCKYKFLRTRQCYMPRYIEGKPGMQMPRKSEVRRTSSLALNSVTMQLCYCRSLCPTQLPRNHRSCSPISCSRILIWADDTMQRAKCSASQIALKGRSCVMSVSWTLRNRRYTELGGALWGSQFSSLLCRTQAYTQMASNCTGNLLQHPQDLSLSDFSAWRF